MNPLLKTCLIIVFGRMADVSLGTIRTVLTVKEKTLQASVIAFFEVFLWFIVVRDALSSEGPVLLLAVVYALGYALGTLVGGRLSTVLIPGRITLEIITSDRSDTLPKAMREAGYELTVIKVNESEFGEPKYLILADVDKTRVKYFKKRVKELDPGAFIMLKDSKGMIPGDHAMKHPKNG